MKARAPDSILRPRWSTGNQAQSPKMQVRCLTVLVAGFLLIGLSRNSFAQELDTLITRENRKPFSIADQIEDPQEREAFLALYRKQPAARQLKMAESFLASYPQSWFLAQVYEVAARASMDLGEYQKAFQYARNSLRLLPENPVLLVLFANLQVQQGLLEEAAASACDALEFLDRFARPQAISETDWPSVERGLRASSHYALARASLTRALAQAPGPERTAGLEQAEKFLQEGRRLNPQDPEIAYLIGLVSISLGRLERARQGFVEAYRLGGPVALEALEQLRKMYASAAKRSSSEDWDTFLARALASRLDIPPQEAVRPPGAAPGRLSTYAGSQTCKQCHFDKYSRWEKTGMARMLQPYRPENVIGDFNTRNSFYAGDEVRLGKWGLEVVPGKDRFLFARMLRDNRRHYFEIRHSGGRWVRYPVDYTIGSKWQQAYATRLPNGQVHVFPIQYNALHRRWLNFWKIIDHAGSERAEVSRWGELSPRTSYHAHCAPCHTSQLKNTRGGGFEADHLEFREPGVNCEMCHGPSQKHVSLLAKGEAYLKEPPEPPVAFDRLDSRDYIAICSQCHMQSALRQPGPGGELNYWREGEPFFVRSKSRPFAEFSRKAFYKDGRFRETTFIVEALLRSACWRKGQVHCGHCHDPHPEDFTANLQSLKFSEEPDRMCLQCHSQYARKIEAHTRHTQTSEGSRCVSCHMPRIMNSLLFKARTHQIDDVPSLEMTLRFGQEESPHACLICHSHKDSAWLSRQLQGRQSRKDF